MPSFLADYIRIIAAAIPVDYSDNYDADRFGPEPTNWRTFARRIRSCFTWLGFITVRRAKGTLVSGMQFVEPHISSLEWLYSNLADAESREILVKVIAFRALGHRKIKLPLNCPEHWSRIYSMKKLAAGSETIDSGFEGWKLPKMDLTELGYPISIFFQADGAVTDFVEQQYRCETPEGPIECAAGDVAIDAGGCWGDTALYFAHKVGAKGTVASFEFLPGNLKIYEKNLGLNPELAKRIRLFKNPVWSCSGVDLFVNANGPATSVSDKPCRLDALKVQTRSIDDLVQYGELERVDFIKMDIEGAELAALQGAAQVIRRFKPELAITVYHNLDDFWTIPQYLDRLNLGYRFYLRHFTIYAGETVLFAKALV